MQAPQEPARLAVVTGANRGLGLELCRQLLDRGWDVAAFCRSGSAELDALAGTAGVCGAAAEGAQANTSRLTVVQGVDMTDDRCGALVSGRLCSAPVSLLICNAGVLGTDSLVQLDSAAIRQQFEINALGPLRVAQALLPNLRAAAAAAQSGSTADGSSAAGGSAGGPQAAAQRSQPGARVAFLGSKMGSIAATGEGGKNGSVGYRMSKAAANMACQLLALELAPAGVPVLAIHPGAVETDMYHSYWAAVQAGAPGGMAPSAHGPQSVQAAAARVLARIDEAGAAGTAGFVQAMDGSPLPW